MSVDYHARISRDFSVQALATEVRLVLVDLGLGETSLGATFWASPEDFAERHSGHTQELDRWMCGPHFEDRWIELTLAPNVLVDIAIYPDKENRIDHDPTAWFGATASYRTPESVVVAIASTIAATRVGQGLFEEVRDPTIHAGVTPEELIERLRVRVPVADFAAGARMMLRAVPNYANWEALDDPPMPTHNDS